MQNFQDNFETPKGSFISVFSICMPVPLRNFLTSAYRVTVNSFRMGGRQFYGSFIIKVEFISFY